MIIKMASKKKFWMPFLSSSFIMLFAHSKAFIPASKKLKSITQNIPYFPLRPKEIPQGRRFTKPAATRETAENGENCMANAHPVMMVRAKLNLVSPMLSGIPLWLVQGRWSRVNPCQG